jgi:hypothetical protein
MTKEIELVKQEIKMLQSKLSFLEELEKTKSPVEEAYKEVYGHYPLIDENDCCRWEGKIWFAFQKGYEAHQSLVDDANKIQAEPSMINCIIRGNPPNGCSSWSEWFELFGSKGILHNLNISAKEYQPKPTTLFANLDPYSNVDREHICSIVEDWLPKTFQSYGEYQEGWNDCIEEIREKLR